MVPNVIKPAASNRQGLTGGLGSEWSRMALPNATSSALTSGRFYYDLEIFTTGDTAVNRLLQGDVDVTQEVTR